MSAQDQMRRMLDELMGTRRNGEDTRQEKLHYSSVRVCKSFLLNCCPHEILRDTRGDMGQCKKVHDVALRADYENSSKKDELNFQREALMQLKSFIGESERRIQIAKVRLAETQENLSNEEQARIAKIKQIGVEINEILAQAEKLGAEGDVDGSLKLLETADALKKEKNEAEEDYRNATPASISQQQKLRVCEVCSSYLGVNDNDRRLADHFNGKLHLGFITIREKMQELEELVRDHQIKVELEKLFKKEFPNAKSKSPSPTRSPSRSPSQKRDRSRSRSHSTERSKHRHRHHRCHHKEHHHKSSRHERSHHRHKHRSHREKRRHSPENKSKSPTHVKLI
ncbi:putative RNA-binding protein Luc7-like 1 [Parasteatoda tepidariorum]|uniref:putative RNA-binding protein Luc7-like 1 n=1 Tax=Parasteatoda tepidariorum TaxID=114398 RepID=UPI00077FC124|nr:putative RNA-binding protein Luc7-like 1 [Parasteatoda tepidariorum]